MISTIFGAFIGAVLSYFVAYLFERRGENQKREERKKLGLFLYRLGMYISSDDEVRSATMKIRRGKPLIDGTASPIMSIGFKEDLYQKVESVRVAFRYRASTEDFGFRTKWLVEKDRHGALIHAAFVSDSDESSGRWKPGGLSTQKSLEFKVDGLVEGADEVLVAYRFNNGDPSLEEFFPVSPFFSMPDYRPVFLDE
ncbi:hypothetical protein [Corynebacterium tuberculostearicum]|uniref:hypothetical protein n=1 Tax=Corynebacterium tuberculostearicum TaxID=38304 RepID=UPI0038D224E2